MRDVTGALNAVDEPVLRRLGFRGDDVADALVARDRALSSPGVLAETGRLASRLVADLGSVGKKDALDDAAAVDGLSSGVVAVLACLAVAEAVQRRLAGFGRRPVGDEVAWYSLADLGQQVWVNRLTHGEFGCGTHTWLAVVFSGVFVRLGRLQFNSDLVDGREVVSTHIPQTGPLDPDAVQASFDRAGEVFGGLPIYCDSWLLDPELAQALPPESNMARFQARWRLVGDPVVADESVLYFAFRRRGAIVPDELPSDTRLHRMLVARWAQGGHWHACRGFLRVGP